MSSRATLARQVDEQVLELVIELITGLIKEEKPPRVPRRRVKSKKDRKRMKLAQPPSRVE